MINRAFYTEQPENIQYMPLPSGEADIWLRKGICESIDAETGCALYAADEAYMRTSASRAEIEADFDVWYALASEWQEKHADRMQSADDRISTLETENKELREQISAMMDAVNKLMKGANAYE